MNHHLKYLTFLALFLVSLNGMAQVWIDQNQWNEEFEETYHQWVQKEWTTDVVSRARLPDGTANPVFGLKPDCADAVYLMRGLFAFKYKLPFAFTNILNTREVINNRTTRWDHLPESVRLKEFFRYSFAHFLSTRSLPFDSYLIPIHPRSFRAGAFGLTVPASHHSWTFKDITQFGSPVIFESTTGIAGRPVVDLRQRLNWYAPAFTFKQSTGLPTAAFAGYRAFRKPHELGQPERSLPGYSDEQRGIPVQNLHSTIVARLRRSVESPQQEITRLSQDLCTSFQQRIGAVRDGVDYLTRLRQESAQAGRPMRCLTREEHFDYSTPSRDQRLFESFIALRNSYRAALQSGAALPRQLSEQLQKIYPSPLDNLRTELSMMAPGSVDRKSLCPVEWGPGKSIDLAEARRRLFLGLFSNSPHDPIEMRWGELQGPSSLARRCSNHGESWTPDLSD